MQESPPLEGIKIVEFGQYIAVPAAAQVLRDLGAEVIKVETSKGDPARWTGWTQDDFGPMFAPFNRGKRSIVLDLSTDLGKQQAFKLAPAADVIPSADGAVVLSAYTDAHFQKLGEAIGQSGLANDPRYETNAERVAHRSDLLATLAQAFAAFTSAQLCERLGKAGLVIAAVRNFSQVRQEANGLSSNLFVQVSSPSKGTLEIPATPFHLDGVSTRPTSLPAIGEHTEEILAGLGQSVAKPGAI